HPLAWPEESAPLGAIFLHRFGDCLHCAGRRCGCPCRVECHSRDFLVWDKGPGISLCLHLVSWHLPALPLRPAHERWLALDDSDRYWERNRNRACSILCG